MHYDEATGDMIGDDDSYMSTPYRSEYSSYASGRGSSDWREKLSSVFTYVGYAVACVLIGAFIGKYRPQDKIEEWWKTFSANHITREDSGVKEETARPPETRLTVTCWRCKTELDATHLKHLMSFDGECSCCRAQLHVEQYR